MAEFYNERSYHPLVAHVAQNSLEWRDENKFTFIWDNQLILMYLDRDRGHYNLLTNVEEHVEKAIFHWLGTAIEKEVLQKEDE